jgi:hypothetical protein
MLGEERRGVVKDAQAEKSARGGGGQSKENVLNLLRMALVFI